MIVPNVKRPTRVRFETNTYSVPARYAYLNVELKVYVDRIEVVADNRVIASHQRFYRRYQQILDVNHYLKVLRYKLGSLCHARLWQENKLPKYSDLAGTDNSRGTKNKRIHRRSNPPARPF